MLIVSIPAVLEIEIEARGEIDPLIASIEVGKIEVDCSTPNVTHGCHVPGVA